MGLNKLLGFDPNILVSIRFSVASPSAPTKKRNYPKVQSSIEKAKRFTL